MTTYADHTTTAPPANRTPVTLTTPPALPSFDEIRACLGQDERGDARLLAVLYTGRLAWDGRAQTWRAWDGQKWAEEDITLIIGLIGEHVTGAYQAARIALAYPNPATPNGLPAWQTENSYTLSCALANRITKLNTYKRLDRVALLARTYLRIGGTR